MNVRLLIHSLIILCISFHDFNANGKSYVAEHVILIGVDGLTSKSLDYANMPTLNEMISNGSSTFTKRSVLPTKSAPNWASMFMGVPTEIHGYTTWDSKTPEIPVSIDMKNEIFPTIFQILRKEQPDSEIGCLYEWEGIKYLVDTLSLSYHDIIPDYVNNKTMLADKAVEYITSKEPELFAVIFDGADNIGHTYGFDSEEYQGELQFIDSEIGRILEAINESKLRDRTVVIVTSDHGGINKDHGGHSIEEIDTPFIVYGHGIKRGYDIESIMMQYDVAVTIAGLLGIIPPNIWRGRYVDSIVDCVNTSIYLPSYEMNVSRISHQFFDTNGIPHSNEPQNGIVIRREIMSDGITKSTKYLKNR